MAAQYVGTVLTSSPLSTLCQCCRSVHLDGSLAEKRVDRVLLTVAEDSKHLGAVQVHLKLLHHITSRTQSLQSYYTLYNNTHLSQLRVFAKTFLRAGLSISRIPCLTRSALVLRLVSANPLKDIDLSAYLRCY